MEQAYANDPVTLEVAIRRGEERVLAAGRTDAGRPLQFVYTLRRTKNSRRHCAYRPQESERPAVKAKRAKVAVDTPRFRSEAEEAEWWDQHQELIADLLVKHGRRGAVPTKNISVRLPVTDLARARKIAERRGVGYQVVIKTLLHEALKRESGAA